MESGVSQTKDYTKLCAHCIISQFFMHQSLFYTLYMMVKFLNTSPYTSFAECKQQIHLFAEKPQQQNRAS